MVNALLEDLSTVAGGARAAPLDVVALLQERGVATVPLEGWHTIRAEEAARGEKARKPREKLVRADELLQHATATAV